MLGCILDYLGADGLGVYYISGWIPILFYTFARLNNTGCFVSYPTVVTVPGTWYQVLRVPGISFYMVRVYDAVYHRMHIAVAPQQWNILTSIIPGRY